MTQIEHRTVHHLHTVPSMPGGSDRRGLGQVCFTCTVLLLLPQESTGVGLVAPVRRALAWGAPTSPQPFERCPSPSRLWARTGSVQAPRNARAGQAFHIWLSEILYTCVNKQIQTLPDLTRRYSFQPPTTIPQDEDEASVPKQFAAWNHPSRAR